MKPGNKFSDHTKIASTASDSPEQVSILGLIGSENASIANYNRSLFWVSSWAEMSLAVSTHLNEVIDCHPEIPTEPPKSTTKNQTKRPSQTLSTVPEYGKVYPPTPAIEFVE